MSSKTTNPLFIVKQDGKVIETAYGVWDALYKTFNLGAFEEFFVNFIEIISKMGNLEMASKILSQFLEDFRTLYENFVVFLRSLGFKFLG